MRCCYQMHRPDVTYTPGLAQLIIFLLLNYEPYETFVILVNFVLGQRYYCDLLTLPKKASTKLRLATEALIEKFRPGIFEAFRTAKINNWKLIVEEWMLGMFLQDFSLENCLILWDLAFSRGPEVFFYVFLRAFTLFEQEFKNQLTNGWKVDFEATISYNQSEIVRSLFGDWPNRAEKAAVEELTEQFI